MRIRGKASGLIGFFSACVLAGALTFGLAGCQKIFSTSLAESLARGSTSLPSDLSVDDAVDLVGKVRTNGDVKLAGELVGTLVDEIAGTTNASKKQELEAAAAAAAIVASDVTSPITTLINSYSDNSIPSEQSLIELAQKIKNNSSSDIVTACSYLDPSTGISDPSAQEVSLSATEYAIAAVIIMASILPDGANPSTYNYTSDSANAAKVTTAKNIITEAIALTGTDSTGYNLLKSISEKFKLM
jgi:hypothetical protein